MKQLIERAKNGDRHSLRELLLMHRHLIESVVRKFTWEVSGREDVVQNVFIKTMTSIKDFSGTCRFSTWIYRVAVNECVDANRRYARKEMRHEGCGSEMDMFPDLNAGDGLASAIGKETDAAVREAVATLPDGMRNAFELFYLQEMTGGEAAENLHITVAAFFVRLSAARERLKKELVKKGVAIC
jgi:RNA polymerase sigma-70 factor, ECF subfamily